jgi:iron complex outermembrane receptor protein
MGQGIQKQMQQRKLLLCTSMIVGFAAMTASTAFAQSQPAPTSSSTTAAKDEAEVEAVVVTGSRIKRTAFTSPSPIQVITSEQSALKGLVDTAEILQQSTATGGSSQTNNELTGYVATGGPGVNTISLRGLGDNRTLVLLNGHRLPPSGVRGTVGPVDLNTVPSSIIDHVEILKDGASAIYGSDAVAGVVNFITKSNMDGGRIKVNANVPFESGGEAYAVDGAWGKTFDRGYVSISGNYSKSEALRRSDRKNTSCAQDYLFNPTTGDRLDYKDTSGNTKCYNLQNNDMAVINAAGASLGSFMYTPSGLAVPTLAQGNALNGAAPPSDLVRMARAGYPLTYPYANYSTPYYDRATMISPVERYSLFLQGGYDLTSTTQVYGELFYNKRKSEQDGVRQLFPTVSASNPNNRFAANGWRVQPIIALPYDSKQDVDYYRAMGGIKGDFSKIEGFLSSWSWDVYGQYGKSSGDYTIDSVYNDRVNATIGASACNQALITISGGQCSTVPNGIAWTSQRVLAGQWTDAEKAFLFGVDKGHTDYEQYLFEGSMTGDLFSLPAGKVGMAIGATYRHDKLDDLPGRESINNNNWGLTAAGHTFGSDATKEVYGELSVPIFKGLPMVEALDLSLSGRYTDVDSYGSDKTYKIGLNYQVLPWVRVRGSIGTSFRAPALYELYLANQTSFLSQTAIDPCINYALSSNPRIQANCAAAGIAGDYAGAGSSALITAGGGAGRLKAETSKAKTVGVIFSPSFADLHVAVDYFEINVKNEVDRFGASNILYECYNAASYNTSGFCGQFTRDPTTHSILGVSDSYVNVAEQMNRGIDLTVSYNYDASFGKFSTETNMTWQLQDTRRVFGSTEDDYNGTTYGYRGPDFVADFTLSFQRGDYTATWAVNAIGKGSDTEVFGGDVFNSTKYANLAAGISSQPAYYKQYSEFTAYHAISLRKKMDTLSITAGVQNLFDELAPSASTGQFRVGTSALNGYDYRGRRAFITIEKAW